MILSETEPPALLQVTLYVFELPAVGSMMLVSVPLTLPLVEKPDPLAPQVVARDEVHFSWIWSLFEIVASLYDDSSLFIFLCR